MHNLLSISAKAGYYIRTSIKKKSYLILVKREKVNCGIMNPLERMSGKKKCINIRETKPYNITEYTDIV